MANEENTGVKGINKEDSPKAEPINQLLTLEDWGKDNTLYSTYRSIMDDYFDQAGEGDLACIMYLNFTIETLVYQNQIGIKFN